MPLDFNYMIAGEAGQGIASVALLLAKAFSRGGYHVFGDQDYESRIRGGHNFVRVRVKDTDARAIDETVDVLVALNAESISLHLNELASRGAVIYDSDKVQEVPSDSRLFGMPLERLATEKGGDRIMTNTVALGAALAVVGYDAAILKEVLTEHFRGGDVAARNVTAAMAGFEHAGNAYQGSLQKIDPSLPAKRLLISGAEMVAMGAIAAGCKFMAAYPMTPTTPIMENFAERATSFGGVMVPAEDEIAAIHMAIGASYAGVRAMTATSGGGFSLMVEGLGLAGMTETPLVIVEGQRAGPAIGLPTRTEQGDLLFLIHASQGEFPRAVLAPTDVEDCFWATVKAFNLADRYQIPVFVVIDHFIASSFASVEMPDLSKVNVDRGELYADTDGDPAGYLRHRITETGVSARGLPGKGKALIVTDSDEHDEAGHLTEDAEMRTRQMDKRLRKMARMKQEALEPLAYGKQYPDILLVGWGSTFGALQDTVDLLSSEFSVGLMQFGQLWPFPAEAAMARMARAKATFVVENNATGQLSKLIRAETGKEVTGKVLKYDGRPFTPAIVAEAIRKETRNGIVS